ncbi:nuclear transport factor 2 family protein [Streptomyces sp. NPDC051315]|uniref:nuclear transport factor 2 family protein n=1 Tax=Streptomyces sp. NPDC051315 TaxID=3365650 RepID=UPI00378D7B37
MTTHSDPVGVYRAYIDAENRQDSATAAALVSPSLRVEINGRPALSSAAEDQAANAELLRRYPDYRRDVLDTVADGSRVAVRWRMAGTPARAGLEPLDVHGCSAVRVQDGPITHTFLYYQGAALDAVLEADS